MLPVLLEIGPLTLHTYGLLVALGFLVGTYTAFRLSILEGEDSDKILDLAFYLIIGGLLGARVLYIIVEWEIFVADPIRIFKIWQGGLVFYGGFIGAMISGIWFVRKAGINIWVAGDIIAPGLAIGHSIGRLACLAAGCCYGKPTDSSFALTFTDAGSMAPLNIPLTPTQPIMSLNELAIFIILIWLRPRKLFAGQILLSWVTLYAIGRFFIEFLRGDPRGAMLGISTSQLLAIVIALIGFATMLWRWKKSKAEKAH